MSNKTLRNVIAENPVLILFLGACPAMGTTSTLLGALGMGAAALIVMLLSGIVISALSKQIPQCARIPVCVIIVAGFVTLVQMLMQAFLPDVYQMMGIYLTVAAVNLMIFANGEAAAQSTVGTAVTDALKTGVFFILVLALMGAIREVFGSGSIAGIEVSFFAEHKISLLTKAPGGFIVFSFMAAVVSKFFSRKDAKPAGTACAAAGLCCCEKEEGVQ